LSSRNTTFQRFALASTLATYFLIFVGGLVRVSGAGLGCPDWPKCFGRWIPPLSYDQVPVGFDSSTFNITLAWIEYINRLVGMITGLLILITALLAIKNYRRSKQILIPSILAAILVAVQGWYGSVVVKSQLMPTTVSVHMLLALIIVSLLIYVTHNSYYLSTAESNAKRLPQRKWLLYLWVISIIQIVLGASIRSKIEIIWGEYPLLTVGDVLSRVGIISYIHIFLGILLAFFTLLTGQKILKSEKLSLISRKCVWLLFVLIVLQILIGMNLQVIGLPPFLQVFHLWIASIYIGIILLLYTELKYQQGP
jgi:cytochrome c oxidase assembly protein subunit 15